MKAYSKQRELFGETQRLRKLDLQKVDFETAMEIRKKEQKLYDLWLFYKNLREEIKKGEKDE